MAVGKWHLAKDSDASEGPRGSWPLPARVRPVLRRPRRVHEPAPPAPARAGQPPGRGRPLPRRLLLHRRHHRPRDLDDPRARRRRTRPGRSSATSPTARCTRRCTPRPEDVAKYRGPLRRRLGRAARRAVRPPAGARAWCRRAWSSRPATPSATTTCGRGTSSPPTSSALFARHMEVYAGMVDSIDQNIGRLLAALDDLGELDNTIFVFTSDNGASREGEVCGTTAYYVHLLQGDDIDADLARIDEIGGPTTTPHYPRGWAMAGNTPFRLYKINTHQGGHSVPFIVSWPDGHRRARRVPRASTSTSPTCCRRSSSSSASTGPPTGYGVELAPLAGLEHDAGARRRRRAGHAPRARRRDERPPRLLPRAAGRRSRCTTGSRRSPTRVGALRPRGRPDRAARPRGRAPGEARRARRRRGRPRPGRTRSTRSTRARASST